MAIKLDGKFIPVDWYNEYIGEVRPIDVNASLPADKQKPPQSFPFRIALDKFGHVYFIPIVEKTVAGSSDKQTQTTLEIAYTINDIVEAAGGNADKRKMIDGVHGSLKQKYANRYVMDDNFADAFLDMARNTFVADYAETFGSQPNVPSTVTTYTRLSVKQAEELASKAIKKTNV